jgi:hypothetical protein
VPGILLAIAGGAVAASVGGKPRRTVAFWLLIISGLGFAGTGLIPAELENGVALVTSPFTKGHFIMSLIQGIAWLIAALLLVRPMQRHSEWRSLTYINVALVMATVGASFALRGRLSDALVQRIAGAIYFGWFVVMSARLIGIDTKQLRRATFLHGLLLFGAVAWTSALGQDAALPGSIPTELRQYLERFTGPEPKVCGQFTLVRPLAEAMVAQLEPSVECAREARAARQSFWTAKQDQGIDSLIFQGLVGTPEGTIHKFSYDSAPCGGPGCPGRFSVERCDQPVVTNERGDRANYMCQR